MFKDIRTIIPKAVKRAGISKSVVEADVFSIFNKEVIKILGEEESEKTKPVFLHDQVLIVASLSDTVAKKLKAQEQEIINNINSYFDNERIKTIKILT